MSSGRVGKDSERPQAARPAAEPLDEIILADDDLAAALPPPPKAKASEAPAPRPPTSEPDVNKKAARQKLLRIPDDEIARPQIPPAEPEPPRRSSQRAPMFDPESTVKMTALELDSSPLPIDEDSWTPLGPQLALKTPKDFAPMSPNGDDEVDDRAPTPLPSSEEIPVAVDEHEHDPSAGDRISSPIDLMTRAGSNPPPEPPPMKAPPVPTEARGDTLIRDPLRTVLDSGELNSVDVNFNSSPNFEGAGDSGQYSSPPDTPVEARAPVPPSGPPPAPHASAPPHAARVPSGPPPAPLRPRQDTPTRTYDELAADDVQPLESNRPPRVSGGPPPPPPMRPKTQSTPSVPPLASTGAQMATQPMQVQPAPAAAPPPAPPAAPSHQAAAPAPSAHHGGPPPPPPMRPKTQSTPSVPPPPVPAPSAPQASQASQASTGPKPPPPPKHAAPAAAPPPVPAASAHAAPPPPPAHAAQSAHAAPPAQVAAPAPVAPPNVVPQPVVAVQGSHAPMPPPMPGMKPMPVPTLAAHDLAPPTFDAPTRNRNKARPWWEELFNDDFIRAMEKLTDPQVHREADFIEDSLGVAKGAMVLDLACGTGRHAIELSKRGYNVVGFDLSLSMLAKAAEEAEERQAQLNFVQGDMREMSFEEMFDGVYCWSTSFGFFEEEKNALVIQRVHRALKKGGQFLLDVVNRDYVARQSPSLVWFEGDGAICMDEMQVDWITSRMKIKRTMMIEDGRSKEIEFSMRLYALHELGKLLHDAGFRVAEVSGRTATPGVFFGADSPRTIILAEKR
jgi:SAM-dependent methyltransferase